MLRTAFVLTLALAAGFASAATIRVDITPGHAVQSLVPVRALGAGVDAEPGGATDQIFTPTNVSQMLSAGWGPVSYRLFTELGVQDWHWNASGTWSDAAGSRGYFTGDASGSGSITHSFGYRLPHRGFTHDQAYDDDFSRLTDGDPTTYWKSNPYLTSAYTGEPDALHPQWVLVDLGSPKSVDAIQLTWADPYATDYRVEYWTGDDALFDQANGQWQVFQHGSVSGGTGGAVTRSLASSPVRAQFVRVLMTASSNRCDTHGAGDPRNCVGYALAEIGVGTGSGSSFADLVRHDPDGTRQTPTYVSSVDPWHDATKQVTETEQPGLDLVLSTSGLARGLPAMVPVALLYGTPDDAAAEIAYLEAHGESLLGVELGEEPDGQWILPEDYGALYLQWATAIHAVDPGLALGGPVFQGTNEDVAVWSDGAGKTSWLGRFIDYLTAHGRLADLGFMSFEHYPFDPCHIAWKRLLDEPGLVSGVLAAWAADGLPPGLPRYVTEYNVSFDDDPTMNTIFGALWHADFVGSFLAAGGAGAFLYQYEPIPLSRAGSCNKYGTFSMLVPDDGYHIQSSSSQFFSTQLLMQEWASQTDAPHDVVPVTSDAVDRRGHLLVTAYAIHRPDGLWAVLLVNKNKGKAVGVAVDFHDSGTGTDHSFAGPVTMVTFGRDQYRWHGGPNGFPAPDGAPVTTTVVGGAGTVYTLARASVSVLRGAVP
jgi:hypothetical protein